MSNFDLHSLITGFHRDKVTLPNKEQNEMRTRRDAGRTRIENGLDLNDHPLPTRIVSQGSYQMRTMVQDEDCDYDIDDGVYFYAGDLIDEDGNSLSPYATRERICTAVKWDGRLKYDAIVKNNCVRQEYPEGYHIDMPVYRIISNDDSEVYELASGTSWKESDARAVTKWFNDLVGVLNSGEQDGSQLRRVTKLTKKFARSRSEWKQSTTSGICITKLVADHFSANTDRDDLSFIGTWRAIEVALNNSTIIEHPVLDENLSDNDNIEVLFFKDCISTALKSLDILDSSDCEYATALTALDTVFNTNYFSSTSSPDDDSSGNGGKYAGIMVSTPGKSSRRNDGGGRFGL